MKRTFQLLYPRQVDDKRKITAKMIGDIVTNSSDSHKFPIARGHGKALGFKGDDAEADGVMSNLRVKDGVLIGDAVLEPGTEDAYKQGKLPGWSVGIYKTKKDGWAMDHLAMLGSVGAAFKDLSEIDKEAFSVTNHSDSDVTVECFNSDKTLWLVQSTPFEPLGIEEPTVNFSLSNGGSEEMDLKEMQKQIDAQAEQFALLTAENKKLKTEKEEVFAAERGRRTEEFKSAKEIVLAAAEEKGVTQPSRDALATAIDGYGDLFANGEITRELFDALATILKELKPKIESGDLDLPEGETFKGEPNSMDAAIAAGIL